MPDQLRRQALGVYGDPNCSTPAMDRLARNGVRFAAACSTYPVCVPFRYTLMTGLSGHRRQIPAIHFRLPAEETTIADEFNRAGYETIYVGKWHLYGGKGDEPVPRPHQGRWSRWTGFELSNEPYKTVFYADDDPAPKRMEGHQTDWIFSVARRELENRRHPDRPFCMFISPEAPHDVKPGSAYLARDPFNRPDKFQYQASGEFMERWRGRELKLPPNFYDKDSAGREFFIESLRGYYAMVEQLDARIGEFLDWLAAGGLARNTTVVLFSDHGDMVGSHELTHKSRPWEESVGIPLIVADPSCPNRGGAVVRDPVCTEDIYPTLMGLCGIRSDRGDLVGRDLGPLLRDQVGAMDRHGVALEFVHEPRKIFKDKTGCWRAFRSRHWKYVTSLAGPGMLKPRGLYNMDDDPFEMHNLIADQSLWQVRDEHHQWLLSALADDPLLNPASKAV
ncbi:MAG: sulfatase-like hydrolase/transferase [Planctomycetes bacterium]|nr:sulfatase-like hydrolase/transferase [Planctomycetota bacterium]